MIAYIDLYNGSDSNDGLTPSTPKLTMNAGVALISAFGDEIRVRGVDGAMDNELGECQFTINDLGVIVDGDVSSSVSVGDYIYKQDSSKAPDLYKVGAVSFNGTNTDITLSVDWGSYGGETEKVTVNVLYASDIPTVTPTALPNNGFYSGDQNSWDRVDTPISGGWNSDFTAQTSYTICSNTTSTSYWSLNNSATEKYYFHLSKWIQLGYKYGVYEAKNWHIEDCYFGWSSDYGLYYNSYTIIDNIVVASMPDDMLIQCNHSYVKNSTFRNGDDAAVYVSANNLFENCNFLKNERVFDTNYSTVKNCNFVNGNTSASQQFMGEALSVIDCSIRATYNGVTYPVNVNNYLANGFSYNGVFKNNSFTNITNPTHKFYIVDKTNGLFVNNYGLEIYWLISSNVIIINDSFNPPLSESAIILASGLNESTGDYIRGANSYVTDPSGNTIQIQPPGTVRLTSDSYEGDNALLLKRTPLSLEFERAVFETVTFEIDSTKDYDLSFYVKSSTAHTITWNIDNNRDLVYDTWQSLDLTTSWAEVTKTINAADWARGGASTLVFCMEDTNIDLYLDKISLT